MPRLSIWKFEFKACDEIEIAMPKGAKVLSVDTQQEASICIWALIDPDEQIKVKRRFSVRGTGHPILPAMIATNEFLGTVMDPLYVWHVFGKRE